MKRPVILSDRIRAQLLEGLASPSAGPITKEKIERLVAEGIIAAEHALRRQAQQS